MKWAVEIQKTNLGRRNLADLLGGLDFTVVETSGHLAFTSDEMNGCRTAAEAFDLAKQLRTAMTGPADIDADFQIGRVVDFSSDIPKRHVFLEGKPAVSSASAGQGKLTIGPPRGLTEVELEAWKEQQNEREYQKALERQRAMLEPAYRNESAAKMLSLLSESEHTGATLYKIYEIAEGHPNNRKKFHDQFGISKDEFQRFKDAVHNPAVSGDWARHAYLDTPGSDNPMTRSEAEHFVRRIAKQWLVSVRKAKG